MDASEALATLQERSFARSAVATATSYPPSHRLTGGALLDVLSSPRYAVVSTTRPKGRPHSAPTAFVLSGTDVWLPTVEGAARLRNVRANPYAVVVVAEGTRGEHLAVIVEGAASVHEGPLDDGVERDVVRQLGAVPDWASAWIVVRPSRLLSYAADDTGLDTGVAEAVTT